MLMGVLAVDAMKRTHPHKNHKLVQTHTENNTGERFLQAWAGWNEAIQIFLRSKALTKKYPATRSTKTPGLGTGKTRYEAGSRQRTEFPSYLGLKLNEPPYTAPLLLRAAV